MKQAFVLIALVALFTSCRSTRTIGKAVSKKDTAGRQIVLPANGVDTQQLIQTTLAQLQANRIGYQTFNTKVAIDYKGTDGKSYSVNATIKMIKDSVIWVSANAILGIEAMRLLVTKDSVKLLNKLEKVYTARSIDYLREVTSLPLNLNTLQEMLIGNPVFLDSTIVRYAAGNGFINLVGIGPYFKHLLTLNEGDKTLVHSKLDDINPLFSRTADLSYSDYDKKNDVLFPTRRQLVVSEKGRLEIKLDFKSYTFNEEVTFPFSVPKNYRRD